MHFRAGRSTVGNGDARRMKALRIVLFAAAVAGPVPAARAVDPWPAETNVAALRLTDVDAGLDAANWSGACWNPDTRMLWLACNSGYFWALVEDGAGGFRVATNAAGAKAKWAPGGDFEAICQTDSDPDLVYVMDENGYIREYAVSNYAATNATRVWNVTTHFPEVGGASGGEGLAFVPDEFLRRQRFCDSNGVATVSSNGMGGLMFVGYQYDGCVYALDLNRATSTYRVVGRYKTSRAETADLHFDRRTGKLYAWHNPANVNYLEVVELGSYLDGPDRRLRQLAEYAGPRNGNLEGFTVAPAAAANAAGGCIVTDDDNLNREAVMWYRQFQPSDDVDADGLSDGAELWHFGSVTQSVGTADADGDGLSNADELAAGTDPTNLASALVFYPPAPSPTALVLNWQSATGRNYSVRSTADLTNGFTNVVHSGIPADAPRNAATVDVSAVEGLTFYRIAAEAP